MKKLNRKCIKKYEVIYRGIVVVYRSEVLQTVVQVEAAVVVGGNG